MTGWKRIDEITFITMFDYYNYKCSSKDGTADFYETPNFSGMVIENKETHVNEYYIVRK